MIGLSFFSHDDFALYFVYIYIIVIILIFNLGFVIV